MMIELHLIDSDARWLRDLLVQLANRTEYKNERPDLLRLSCKIEKALEEPRHRKKG
jgi:hypothetical protein